MNDTAIIICSHLQSKRVPKKAFLDIAGVPAMNHILSSVQDTGIKTVVAVPESEAGHYQHLKSFKNVSVFTGFAMSPLHRMAAAAKSLDPVPEWIVRITHDDVIVDAITMTKMVTHAKEKGFTYVCCPGVVEGAGVEVFAAANLFAAVETAVGAVEHISYFVKDKDPKRNAVYTPRPSIARPHYRLTLDYPEDALVLGIVLGQLRPLATCDEICAFIDQHPQVMGWNRQPLATIYTCAYNAERWIEETMRSVIHGNQGDLEYIVIDDGSTDRTPVIVSKFSDDLQKRVRFIRNKNNVGLASSSNLALAHARGKYVMRLDADDRLMPSAVPDMIQHLARTGAGIVYSNYHEIDDNGSIIKLGTNVSGRLYHHAGCAVMDKRLINELRFRDGLRHWDSHELYSKRIDGKFGVAYLEMPNWYYRVHSGSMSKSDPKERKRLLEVL